MLPVESIWRGTMLITRDQIEEILRYKFNEMPVTSLYIDVDPSRNTKEEYLKNIKTLIRESKAKLKKEKLSRDGYYSVLGDFDRISSSVGLLKGHAFKGLAFFSSSKNGFFQIYQLDEQVKDRIVVDSTPYTRPLFAILRLKKRYITLLFKKDKLRVLEVYGDKIKETIDLFSKSHFSSRSNAYIFTNEKKYQNRLETEYSKFLCEASNEVLDLFMKSEADYIVLGGEKKVCQMFFKSMHPYLKERYAGCIDVAFEANNKTVHEAVKGINEEKREQLDTELTDRIKEELSKEGEACKGIQEVLKALSIAAVSVIVIEEGYVVPGFMDRESGIMYLKEKDCKSDASKLIRVSDMINEAVDDAIHYGAEVRIVKNKALMDGLDHIAALLRFKLVPLNETVLP